MSWFRDIEAEKVLKLPPNKVQSSSDRRGVGVQSDIDQCLSVVRIHERWTHGMPGRFPGGSSIR